MSPITSDDAPSNKVLVYGWRIVKRNDINRFKPEDIFKYKKDKEKA